MNECDRCYGRGYFLRPQDPPTVDDLIFEALVGPHAWTVELAGGLRASRILCGCKAGRMLRKRKGQDHGMQEER